MEMNSQTQQFWEEMYKLRAMYVGAWAFLLGGCVAFPLLPRGIDFAAIIVVGIGFILRGVVERAVAVAFPQKQDAWKKWVSVVLAGCAVGLLGWSISRGVPPNRFLLAAVVAPAALLFLWAEQRIIRVLIAPK